ncbi:hypothetical protein IMZ48_24820 [Candidatus Bathyarchaeota archaeon]|nr:hypothetical protein [Candidatus Bathyarchaeota archaeon]
MVALRALWETMGRWCAVVALVCDGAVHLGEAEMASPLGRVTGHGFVRDKIDARDDGMEG